MPGKDSAHRCTVLNYVFFHFKQNFCASKDTVQVHCKVCRFTGPSLELLYSSKHPSLQAETYLRFSHGQGRPTNTLEEQAVDHIHVFQSFSGLLKAVIRALHGQAEL